jgi:pimeloyl-ACP methyl ester carboxylesterase
MRPAQAVATAAAALILPCIWLVFGWRLALRLLERRARACLRLPLSPDDAVAAAEAARLLAAASPGLALPRATHEWVPVTADSSPPVKLHVVRLPPPAGVPPSGRTILCVHGFPEFWGAWAPAMAALAAADGHTVAAVDMRGYGESDKPPRVGDYGIGALAADIVAVAQHLRASTGSPKITIVGHDWGGQVAAHAVALGGPDLFEAAALLCIPFPGASSVRNVGLKQAARSWYIGFFQAPWLAEEMMGGRAAAAIGALVRGRRAEAASRAVDDAARARAVEAAAGLPPAPLLLEFNAAVEDAAFRAAFLRPGAATAAINYYRALVRGMLGLVTPRPATRAQAAAFKARLRGSFGVPLLMLYAARDVALGLELLAGTDALVPDLELRVLDASHWLPAARPREVIARLRAFVKRTGG